MPNDSRDGRTEAAPVVLAWGMPSLDGQEGAYDPSWWLAGGALLLAWTAVSLLLTSA